MAGRGEVPLVGRQHELGELRDALIRAKNGTFAAVLLEGEAGIGKTRLIDGATAYARDLGFTVFDAAADETDRSRSFGLLIEAFVTDDEQRRTLQDLLARPTPTAADRFVAFADEAMSIIESVSDSAPVALVLDDIHWADIESLAVLRAIVRRIQNLPVALLLATRPSSDLELERFRAALMRAEGGHVFVGPLRDEAVTALVDRVHTDTPTPALLDRVASANGNPFFIIELIGSAAEEEQLPSDLRRSVLRRLSHLSDEAKTAVRLAALLGPSTDIAELATVGGRPSTEMARVVDDAVGGGILDMHGRGLGFRHDIVREAVYADIPESVRKHSHREIARALAASGASSTRVATHLALAAQPGDLEAVSWLQRAAAEESHRSPLVAARMLTQAAELLPDYDPARDRIDAERAQVLAWTGRMTEASDVAREALARLDDPELSAEVHASLGESLLVRGRLIEAAEHLEPAAPAVPASRRALLYAEAGLARLISGQLDRSHELCESALTECAGSDDPRARSLATAVKGLLAHLHGDPSAIELCRAAVRIADEDPSGQTHRYGIRFFLGFTLSEADRDDEAVAVLRKGIRLDEARGVAWTLPTYHTALAALFFVRGEWDDAVAELEVAEQLLEEMESSLLGPLTHGLQAYIACRRDDQSLADKHLALGDRDLAEAGPQVGIDWMIRTRAALAADEGNVGAAAAVLQAAWSMAEAMGIFVAFRFFGPTYVRFALAAADRDAATRAADAVELVGRTGRTRAMPAIVALCRGMLAADEALLTQAVETLRTASRPLDFVIACEEAAAVVEANGNSDRAARLRDEALAIYEAMGAQRDVRRLSDAMRGPGARGKRPKTPRPVSGWGSLSRTERRVAALVAEGLSNSAIGERMFVSPRTVETHLTHVFRKVGVTSRLELAVQASRELTGA